MSKISTVYVIVLNWNRAKDTIGCLKSVQELRIKDYELWVTIIDNASTDDSVEKIRKHIIPALPAGRHNSKYKILVNNENLGFAGGNNVGIKYALENGADYVCVLNNDTIVHPNLIIRIIDTFKKDHLVGMASPKIYFAPGFEFHIKRYKKEDLGRVIWYAGGEIDWNNVYGKTRGVDEVDRGQYNKREETDFATGTCIVFSRSLLEKVGMFDEKYFMYYEDTDLSVRAKRAGFKILFVPEATIWHKVAQSSGIGSDLNDYFISRNRLLFGYRFASMRTKVALIRESIQLLFKGRRWQRIGVRDFYLGRFGKGSWQ